MRSALIAALVAGTGCSQLLGLDDFHLGDAGADADDAPPDAAPDGATCLGDGLLHACFAPPTQN